MQIIYSHGRIFDFIESLDGASSTRVNQTIKRLGMHGHELREPHSKSLKGGLFELRVLGAKQIRIIYAFHNGQAILLNIFIKKVWTIPRKEIEYAKKIFELYISKHA